MMRVCTSYVVIKVISDMFKYIIVSHLLFGYDSFHDMFVNGGNKLQVYMYIQ